MTDGHADREHRRYSPSQSERFIKCPGSVRLLERLPVRTTSKYAIEGTKAHEVLQHALENGIRRAKEAHEDSYLFADDCSDDMADFYYSIQVALNHVYAILDEYPDAVMWLETYVDPPSVSAPGETGGHCDIAIYIPSERRLIVIDFKHGAGETKAANDNTQIQQYGAGFLFGPEAKVNPDDVDLVTLTILQPRAFHKDGPIREWDVIPYDLTIYLDWLDERIALCEAKDAPLVAGKHCDSTFCDARATCPAREASSLTKINDTFHTIRDVVAPKFPDPNDMDVTRLALIVNWKSYITSFLNTCEERIEWLLRSGHDVPGFKLVESEARREWYGDENEVAWKLAALAGVDVTEVLRMKLMTITDAEKLVVEKFKQNVGRGKKKQAAEDAKVAMAHLTLKKSSGKVSVAPNDDPRPAVNKTAMAFAGVAGLLQPPTIEHRETET